jgi:hypothetical protein
MLQKDGLGEGQWSAASEDGKWSGGSEAEMECILEE